MESASESESECFDQYDGFDRYDDLEYLGKVLADESNDFSKDDLYPDHIKNKEDATVCKMFLSEDTFRFGIFLGKKFKPYDVKLEDVQYERVDHKNNILTVVAKYPHDMQHNVHHFFSFSSTKSNWSLYQPFQILTVS